ncbi:hypothetical protein AR687_11545 [Flavobacteriaceae bacterium CRH]|nr:hypothetical protein AR687_11545 [Flavobacteriaceae bacterium CRH]
MSKIIKFVKDKNGNVLLYRTQDNSLITSFNPAQNVVGVPSIPNRFKIQSEASFGTNPFVLDYLQVNTGLCDPIITADNFNDFLIELARKFFFMDNDCAGEKGEQGLQGIQGEQGIQGVKGDTGLQGEQGIQGIKGDVGLQGEQGLKGDTGIQGVTGEQGIQGLKGEQGLQGVQGAKGDIGLQGLQGIQGVKGDTGLQGLQGVQGVKGDIGLQGLQGVQGAKGDVGLQGLQGIQGVKGDTGLQGLQGIQGVKGDTGTITTSPTFPLLGNITLSDAYNNGVLIVGANITITIPVGLRVDFECNFITRAGMTLTLLLLSGVIVINNVGLVMAGGKMSTLKKIGATNEFVLIGEI